MPGTQLAAQSEEQGEEEGEGTKDAVGKPPDPNPDLTLI